MSVAVARAAAIFGTVTLALGAGVVVANPPEATVSLTALIAALLIAPIVVRLAHGEFDLFEPIVWVTAAFFATFVVRPLALMYYGVSYFRGQTLSGLEDNALRIALIGVLGLYAGYFGFQKRGHLKGWRLPSMEPVVALTSAMLMLIVSLASLALIRFQVGASGLEGITSSAYAYMLPFIAVPASLIFSAVGSSRRSKFLSVLGLVTAGYFAYLLAPQGQRLWLMLVLLSIVVFHYLHRQRRPAKRFVVLVLALGFFLAVSMRDAGYQNTSSFGYIGESTSRAVAKPGGVIEQFLTGADTEMFDSLAVATTIVPSRLGYHPGYTLKSMLLHPVPRFLWPDKPRQAADGLNAALYPSYVEGTAGPAYSILGDLYYDSGLLGVFIGMIVVGAGWRRLWALYSASRSSLEMQLVYAASLPFAVVLCRGTFLDTLSRSLFIVAPLIVVPYASRFFSASGVR